ncbi:mitochondrial carrier [Xylona heveae TC161]|uniref:Mitochondrial carrier n=1 Tax=Xylona heveae (strain CBS 132557 / TC161) TaxID=1328760 RepID=A0A165A6Q9_XYLHT|nr:mitochondrial carrier [Xylona heveae TC161]KZF20030.1 mitochondrial carrier [Xylona heveae TC161]
MSVAPTTATATNKAQNPAIVKKDADYQKSKHIRYPFWFGGSASCCAAAVTHPLDLVKVRLQTAPKDAPKRMLGMFIHVIKENGVPGLYKGLSASLLRQITYSTTRFGVYEKLKDGFTTPEHAPSMATLVGMACTSGFLGGLAGNPADVLNVRMQHDAALPPAERRNYRNAIDGLIRMSREEGLASLFRGVGANSARAVLMTASQLASYDGFKRSLLANTPLEDNLTTHFTASFLAGFVATTICSPVDVIKTRVMSAKETKGLGHLLADIYRHEGITWMFRGWVPSFMRLGPHTIATFLFLEEHKKYYRKWNSL